jgi:hypothetical protein
MYNSVSNALIQKSHSTQLWGTQIAQKAYYVFLICVICAICGNEKLAIEIPCF